MKVEAAKRVLKQEAEGILNLSENLDDSFRVACDWVLLLKGRLILCGLGKSGHIGRKAAATFASTGTTSFFLHAAEAMHGDLGMIMKDDIVVLISNSGETDELIQLIPAARSLGARLIALTSRSNSSLAHGCDLVLCTHVGEEACPNNLAPTTSTTVMLALLDAWAVTVMEARGFGREEFAKLHPGGTLGKRLTLLTADVMRGLADCAVVRPETPCLDVLKAITQAGLGAAMVTGDSGELLGLISDGDLRRYLINHSGDIHATAAEMMTKNPMVLESSLLAYEAFEVFQNSERKIGEIPVVDGGKLAGMLSLKDLLRSGII